MHKYKIKYDIRLETKDHGYCLDDAGDLGLADGLVLFSIIHAEDGSYSQAIVLNELGSDKLSQDDIFKLWLTLGISLSEASELTGWKKEYVQLHADSIRKLFKEKI